MNLKLVSFAVAAAFAAGSAGAQTVVKIGHVGPLTGSIAPSAHRWFILNAAFSGFPRC